MKYFRLLLVFGAIVLTACAASSNRPGGNSPSYASQSSSAQPSSEKERLANRYLRARLNEEALKGLSPDQMDELIGKIRRKNPEITDAQFRRLRELMEPKLPLVADRIILSMSKAYAERFTVPELREMVRFHESPVGQKIRRLSLELEEEMKEHAKDASKQAAIELFAPVILQWTLEIKATASS